jgi:hypothetical protein
MVCAPARSVGRADGSVPPPRPASCQPWPSVRPCGSPTRPLRAVPPPPPPPPRRRHLHSHPRGSTTRSGPPAAASSARHAAAAVGSVLPTQEEEQEVAGRAAAGRGGQGRGGAVAQAAAGCPVGVAAQAAAGGPVGVAAAWWLQLPCPAPAPAAGKAGVRQEGAVAHGWPASSWAAAWAVSTSLRGRRRTPSPWRTCSNPRAAVRAAERARPAPACQHAAS